LIAAIRIGAEGWEAVIRRLKRKGSVTELVADRNGLKLNDV
jgi:hypothetical protein